LSDIYDLRTALIVISFVPVLAALLFFIGGYYYELDVAMVEKFELMAAWLGSDIPELNDRG